MASLAWGGVHQLSISIMVYLCTVHAYLGFHPVVGGRPTTGSHSCRLSYESLCMLSWGKGSQFPMATKWECSQLSIGCAEGGVTAASR